MKCACVETTSYERLNESFLDYSMISEDKDNATNEKEVFLKHKHFFTGINFAVSGGDGFL